MHKVIKKKKKQEQIYILEDGLHRVKQNNSFLPFLRRFPNKTLYVIHIYCYTLSLETHSFAHEVNSLQNFINSFIL